MLAMRPLTAAGAATAAAAARRVEAEEERAVPEKPRSRPVA